MCGIAGLYNFHSSAPASRSVLESLARRMSHRGPDGEGFHLDGPLGLAHRRLAIIDLEGGVQPMSTADGSLWISYNGEVFNYLEILDELRALGHAPRTRSDTEAVLLAYRQWGLDFVHHLNGMFAFAIWDGPRRRLVLGRDRLGVKPLYYARTPDGLAFASELKALRGVPGVDVTLDVEALDDYMTLGYVVNPRTLLRGARKLEPGTLLSVEPGGELAPRRYWSLRFEPDHGPSRDEWAERVRALFEDSVRLRLRSDVPVGVLLSGGLDSTAIATTVARLQGTKNLNSYCAGVELEGADNEFKWARLVAQKLGTVHHEERLTPAQNGALLIEAGGLLDEPLVEPMVAQHLAVCRLARKDVTVVLSGEGADETFFGYTAYRTMNAIEMVQRLIPRAILGRAGPVLDLAARAPGVSASLAKHLRLLAEPLERRYLGLSFFDTTLRQSAYSPHTRDALRGRDARETMRRLYDDCGGPEALSRMAAVDCRAWLVDNTLLRSDLMSMAASVELRVPFLDYRLVELAARIPASYKVGLRAGKQILRHALADRIPHEILTRPKVGFPTPIASLFRSEWGREAEDVITNPSATTSGLFDRATLGRLMAEHRAGRDFSRILFQVLMLEYWARAGEAATPHFREVA